MSTEYLISWRTREYRLDLYDTNKRDDWGKPVLAYQFFHNGTIVFDGADFSPSPLHAIDGPETVSALIGFLSLRPGDTDADYFARYDRKQLAFACMWGEELSLYGMDDDEALREVRAGMVDLSETLTVALYLRKVAAMS